jgi:hypothetical protein
MCAARNNVRMRRVVVAVRDRGPSASRIGQMPPYGHAGVACTRMKVAITRFYAGGCHIHPARWGRMVTVGAPQSRK